MKKLIILLVLYLPGVCFGAKVPGIIRVKVKQGETLHQLAQRYLKDPRRWPEIYKYNRNMIENPHLILPDMVVNIPQGLIKKKYLKAEIIELKNSVRKRKFRETAWKRAVQGSPVGPGDAVRTSLGSYARLRFELGEPLRIGENSFVILRKKEHEAVELKTGSIRAGKVRTLTSSVEVRPATENADYIVEVENRQSSRVSVLKGEVDISNKGKSVTLSAGYSLVVKYDSEPDISSAVLTSRQKLEPGVLLAVDSFTLQISSRENFKPCEYEKRYGIDMLDSRFWKKINSSAEITKHCSLNHFLSYLFREADEEGIDLEEGSYFWRLQITDYLGIERITDLNRLVLDQTPPAFDIINPANGEEISSALVKIKGNLGEKECFVTVNNREAEVIEQSFCIFLPADPGENVYEIKVLDSAGNISSRKLTVKRKS